MKKLDILDLTEDSRVKELSANSGVSGKSESSQPPTENYLRYNFAGDDSETQVVSNACKG